MPFAPKCLALDIETATGNFPLPAAVDVEERVETIIHRYHHQSKPECADQNEMDHWHVVVPTLPWTIE